MGNNNTKPDDHIAHTPGCCDGNLEFLLHGLWLCGLLLIARSAPVLFKFDVFKNHLYLVETVVIVVIRSFPAFLVNNFNLLLFVVEMATPLIPDFAAQK